MLDVSLDFSLFCQIFHDIEGHQPVRTLQHVVIEIAGMATSYSRKRASMS